MWHERHAGSGNKKCVYQLYYIPLCIAIQHHLSLPRCNSSGKGGSAAMATKESVLVYIIAYLIIAAYGWIMYKLGKYMAWYRINYKDGGGK